MSSDKTSWAPKDNRIRHCDYPMHDGAPCGVAFVPRTRNAKRCDRHLWRMESLGGAEWRKLAGMRREDLV